MDDGVDTTRLLRLIPRLAAHPKFGRELVRFARPGEDLLLADLLAIGPDATIDDDPRYEMLVESAENDFSSFGRQVLCVGWDSDFPGGSGAVWVYELEGIYIASSSDPCPGGPFESLEELMTEGPFQTAFGRPDIQSDVLDQNVLMELAARLIVWEDREIARVNGVAYIPKDGVLVPYEEDDEASEEPEKG